MANFYLDISAIGNEYQAYADTPTTWGIPQDGNGKAGPGHSAAVAIATIDCTSAQGDGAQTLSILGVTVSDTSAGSGTTLAASLVTSINATATATTATYCQALLPLNKLVFARQNPGAMAQVQIMLRIAGTDWNTIAPTHAGFTTGPTITAFTGGVDGPFAYWWNVGGTVFGKTGGANASPAYGIAGFKTAAPSTGEPTAADPIIVRSRRNSADLVVSHSSNIHTPYQLANTVPRTFVIDNGTTWSGDNGQFTISTVNTYNSGYAAIYITAEFRILARKFDGFRWRHKGTTTGQNSSAVFMPFSVNAAIQFEGCYFEEDPDVTNVANSFGFIAATAGGSANCLTVEFRNCHFFTKSARVLFAGNSNGGPCIHRFIRTAFEYNVAATGIVSLANAAASYPTWCEFIRCTFKDRTDQINPVVTSPIAGSATSATQRIIFDQCYGVAAFTSGLVASQVSRDRLFAWTGLGANKEFRYESGLAITEWRAGANFPTLGHLLPSGVEWSIKCLLRDVGAALEELRPVRVSSFYRAASASKIITLELLTPVTFTKAGLSIEVAYTDDTGVSRVESSSPMVADLYLGSAGNLDSSTAAWSMNGSSGYSANKLSITTDYPIQQNTEVVGIVVHKGRLPGNTDQTIIVAPQLVFA